MNRKATRLRAVCQIKPSTESPAEERLSISECRAILQEEAKDLTDDRIIEIRDYLYKLAAIGWEQYQYSHSGAGKLINLEQHQTNNNEESNYLRTG